MNVAHPMAWKVAVAAALVGVILISFRARAPRRAIPNAELRRLVLSALVLYGVGGLASLTHHPLLAAFVYACGITVCALAAWLSRGGDSGEDPPGGGEDPGDEEPPPGPEGMPAFDWDQFERDFRAYSSRPSEGAGVE